ncbi:HAD family hydrolase [Frigidibacter oleivorans]|uniref:HAD family hydrolase n=1 Tax=Frigidibacter oleivorans TaxID=2487129 RepID=UPI000F8EFB8A|nr:HAD family hydrolase [Frigidibacter oleivorans]
MIVFDLDDTLYLERDFAFSGYDHLGERVQALHGVAGFGPACRALFEAGERRRIFDLACARLGWAEGAALVPELVAAYRAHPPRIALCPDAARWLDSHPGPFGLITDGPGQMQANKIAALGIVPRIAHRCVTDWLGPGRGKPHPAAFALMEQAGGAGRMVYVADNPAKDFVTPKARGWLTVQVTRPGGVHDPAPPDAAHAAHLRLADLDQLDSALAGAPA